jgi:hypothetical protein
MNITKTLNNLAQNRPIFYSEADFQFALGWQLKEDYGIEKIFFERPIEVSKKIIYLDLFFIYNNKKIAIELKYKTSEFKVEFPSDEQFHLKEQAALDLGRFDVLNDLQRIEMLAHENKVDYGYVIFLTNCSAYWTDNQYKGIEKANDIDFRLTNGRNIRGSLQWQNGSKETTYGKDRINGLKLEKSYDLIWNDYYKFDSSNKNNIFRYLIININEI